MDEDDEFGEFGGFEAAEPVPQSSVPPSVAQPGGQQASPSPWALLSTGYSTVEAKPDLLCRENKFPQVLDPTVSGGPSEPNRNSSLPLADGANGRTASFDADFPVGASAALDVNLDDATLANRILDGRLISSPSTLSSSTSPAVISGRPASGSGVDRQISSDNQILSAVGSMKTDIDQNSAKCPKATDTSTHIPNQVRKSSANLDLANSGTEKVDFPLSSMTKVDASFSSDSFSVGSRNPSVSSLVGSSTSMENMKKTSSCHQDLEQNTGDCEVFSSLSTDIGAGDTAGIKSKLSNSRKPQRENYTFESVSSEAVVEEMKQIKLESRAAVKSVVQEYRDLIMTNLQSEREAMEGHVRLSIQEQEEKFRSMLSDMQSKFDEKLEEEKLRMAEKKTAAVKEESERLKKEYEEFLQSEREKNEASLLRALEEERRESKRLLMEALEEEREKRQKEATDQREIFRQELKEERQKHEEELQKSLQEQKERFQAMLKTGLEEERKRGEEAWHMKITQMETQKMLDSKVHKRHMASIDVFLEGARQQLSLLMEKSDTVNSSSNSNGSGDST